MFEKIKQNVKAVTAPTNTEINPETGQLNVDEMLGQDLNQNGGLPVMSAETIANAQPPAQPDDTLYTLLDNGGYVEQLSTIIYPVGTKFYFRHEDGTYYESGIEIGPDVVEPKAPLAEAESLLAWLKTQPSTPENKAMRAQAGIVVDYLKAE